MTLNT